MEGSPPRLGDYLRRSQDFWVWDLSAWPPPTLRGRVLIYVLRCYRMALPWLRTAFGGVATILGVSALTIWGIVKDLQAGDFVIAAVGLLLVLLVIGAYRLWNDTEADKGVVLQAFYGYQQAEAQRTNVQGLLNVEGNFLAQGLDLLSSDTTKEEVRQMCGTWTAAVRQFIADAYGMGEHALLLARMSIDAEPVEQVGAGVDYLHELLEGRGTTLLIRDGFDPQPWIEAFIATGEEDEEEQAQP
jgi:hypothetical protein